MESKNNNKKKMLLLVAVFAVIIVTMTASFAFFTYSRTGTNELIIKTGKIEFAMIDGTSVSLTNKFPQSDTEGNQNEAYNFEVRNTSDEGLNVKYSVSLVNSYEGTANYFSDSQIKYSLVKNDAYVIGGSTSGEFVSTVITSGNEGVALSDQVINAGETDRYSLRIWIASNVVYGTEDDIDENGLLVGEYNDYKYSLKVKIDASDNQAAAQPAKAWTLTTDNNGDGQADIGDLICVSTECFYVYSNDGTNIKALAQYNLYVGGTYNSGWTAYGSEATGLQDSRMRGYVSGQTEWYGTTAFSSDEVKGTNYSDYTGSIVEQYVNQYVTKLAGMNANIISSGLMTKEEIEILINNGNELLFGDNLDEYVSDIIGKEWIYSTSYWTRSAYNVEENFFILNKSFDFMGSDVNSDCGVRPVITISASEI